MAKRPSLNPAGNPATLIPGGGRKGKANLTDRVRSAFEDALVILDRRQKPLKELMADALEQNPIAALNALSKFCPIEAKVEHSGSVTDFHLAALRELTRRTIPSPVEQPMVIDVQAVTIDPDKPS